MLALLTAVALSQCSADVDCKGERVCEDGKCVGARLQPPVNRVARAAQLGEEIGQRKAVLEDASFVGPSLKLGAGIVVLVLGVFSTLAYQNVAYNYVCDSACLANGMLGIPSLVIGPALILWGGIQLVLSAIRHASIPEEIRVREDEIRVLGQ